MAGPNRGFFRLWEVGGVGPVCGFCVAAPLGRARLLLPGAVETAEGAAADADMANDDEDQAGAATTH